MKSWITIHKHTANPRASLIRSPGSRRRAKGFRSGAAHAHGHDHERPDKQRTKSDGQYSQWPDQQPHRGGRCPDVRRTELLRFGAHGLNLAPIRLRSLLLLVRWVTVLAGYALYEDAQLRPH